MLVLMSTMYRGVEQKLKVAEEKKMELSTLLKRRDEMLQELATTINELEEKFGENELLIEMQKNELKEQSTILREMHVALRLKRGSKCCDLHDDFFFCAESSQEFWILRKYQRNLVLVTKPHIREIIKAAMEAGLVSENIGKCAVKCLIPQHDCADGFYKALLVKVDESPEALKLFLEMVQERLKESKPCQQLCNKMLAELSN